VAVLVGAVSGLIPAWQASRLRIVDALRRVN
jgi:ABC-type antimicrobial peptide transport system permease subunit